MTKQMTGRERILNTLAGKPTDRLAWSPLIDPYFIDSLPAQGYNLEIIEAMRYIGNDIMERHVAMPTPQIKNVEIRTERHGSTTRTYYETPVGTVFYAQSKTDSTTYISKHFIETVEDMRVFQYIAENTTFISNAAAFHERDLYIGDSGIATASMTESPIQEMLQHLCGVENTVFLMADYPEETEALLAALHQKTLRQCAVLAAYDTPVIFAYEDTSTTVMNKSMLCDYELPHTNDYDRLLRKSGKRLITHMCGKLSGFKEEIAKGEMYGIDSVCPPTTGDLPIWEARAAFGDKLLIGGIEPPSLVHMTVRQTLDTVAEILRRMKDKSKFILSTGDAVPHGTPIQNLMAVTRLIERMGAASLGTAVDEALLDEIAREFENNGK